jgi:hypothetical protein
MAVKPLDREKACEISETPRNALGRFLRERRESIDPEHVGISSRRGRRTPGLRREEVAFLADIGVKWYARLEAGGDIHPSESTLTGIALALRMSNAEFEYMLDLAGLRRPLPLGEVLTTMPEPIPALLASIRDVALVITDKILTPLRWNALADVIYDHSRYEHPVERNVLVRSLFDPEFIAILGSEREEFVLRAVGMFRLNYSSPRPSPLTAAVYEKVQKHPFFQRAWNRRIVAAEVSNEKAIVRNHALVGALTVYGIDFSVVLRPDLLVCALVPADEATATKLGRLAGIARERSYSIERNELRNRLRISTA